MEERAIPRRNVFKFRPHIRRIVRCDLEYLGALAANAHRRGIAPLSISVENREAIGKARADILLEKRLPGGRRDIPFARDVLAEEQLRNEHRLLAGDTTGPPRRGGP